MEKNLDNSFTIKFSLFQLENDFWKKIDIKETAISNHFVQESIWKQIEIPCFQTVVVNTP